MQKYQAIFVIGSPGSGKDVIIRDTISNFNIVEFTSTQIDEMLSDDSAFKRAKYEKRNSLLERKSILVTANSFDLWFILTKSVLESVGYTPHLIFVEANLSVSYDRLHNRNNLKESLERISIGNNNKSSILELFDSLFVVDNSENLDLTESREFISDILSELSFKSDLTVERVLNVNLRDKLQKTSKPTISRQVPGPAAIVLPIIDSFDSKEKKKTIKKYPKTPSYFFDGSGDQQPNIALGEAEDWPIASPGFGDAMMGAPGQQSSAPVTNLGSDQQKQDIKKVLNKIKKIHFKTAIPKQIG